MVKISHEAPIELIKESLEFNDYQYCLVHLLEENEEYLRHFEWCRDNGVHVLLDNSIFELGTAFDSDRYAYWIDRLRPNEYIIPDVLEDMSGTLENLHSWLEKYSHFPGKKIGVVQGKTYSEIVECYQHLTEYVDKIAISFDYSYYRTLHTSDNKWDSFSIGRQRLIKKLIEDKVIRPTIPIHLLGCAQPQEFHAYRKMKFIESLDTSNPIVHGLLGISYEWYGLDTKESIKLCELIDAKVSEEKKSIIRDNIAKFRKFCK